MMLKSSIIWKTVSILTKKDSVQQILTHREQHLQHSMKRQPLFSVLAVWLFKLNNKERGRVL